MYPDSAIIHQTLFSAIRAALALTASEADRCLLRAYTDIPAAEPPRTSNVCYYYLQTDPRAPLLQETSTALCDFASSSDESSAAENSAASSDSAGDSDDTPASSYAASSQAVSSHTAVDSFIPCRLILTFYGPDCESWAHRARTFLYLDGAGKPRQILRSAGLYPIPNPSPPSILYEESAKSFRKRADVTIDLRLLDFTAYGSAITQEPVTIDTVETTPDVQISVSK